MPLDNFFADRQTNPGSLILRTAVEPLKDVKYTLSVLFIDTYAVIADRK